MPITVRVQLGFSNNTGAQAPKVNCNFGTENEPFRKLFFQQQQRRAPLHLPKKRRDPYSAPWLNLNATNVCYGFAPMMVMATATPPFSWSMHDPTCDGSLSESCSGWSSSSQLANSESDANATHTFVVDNEHSCFVAPLAHSSSSAVSDRSLANATPPSVHQHRHPISDHSARFLCENPSSPPPFSSSLAALLNATSSAPSIATATILVDGDIHCLAFGSEIKTLACHSGMHFVMLKADKMNANNNNINVQSRPGEKSAASSSSSSASVLATASDADHHHAIEACAFELVFWHGAVCIGVCAFSLSASGETFSVEQSEAAVALATAATACVLRLLPKHAVPANSRATNNHSEQRFVDAALQKLLKTPDGAPRLGSLVAEVARESWAPAHAMALLQSAPGVNVFGASSSSAVAAQSNNDNDRNCVARKKAKPKYHRQVPDIRRRYCCSNAAAAPCCCCCSSSSSSSVPPPIVGGGLGDAVAEVRFGIRQMLASSWGCEEAAASSSSSAACLQNAARGEHHHHHRHPAWKQCGATFSTMMRHFQKLPTLFEWSNDGPAGRTIIARRRLLEHPSC